MRFRLQRLHSDRGQFATGSADNLTGRIKRGLAWSSATAIAMRIGSLIVGIVLARLLAPADFGVYAVALAVQSILLTLTDLGMSADLVRSRDFDRRAPTISTISLVSGVALCGAMTMTASVTAQALGSPAATSTIIVLSFTLVIAAVGVTPYAKLQREFEQRKLFATGAIDLGVSSVVTVLLVLAGIGPLALGIGRLAAQFAGTTSQFLLARIRPQFGFDRTIASSALHYGLPLAAANLVSWALLSVDKVVIARVSGEVALGIYVLAFNVASWPMTAIGQAIRPVSLAAFAHLRIAAENEEESADPSSSLRQDRSLVVGVGYAWAAGLPAGILLAALSLPLVAFLYGEKWIASAGVLAVLAAFGALRVLFDVSVTYLLAAGASRSVMWIQLVWIAVLVPAIVIGARLNGGIGVGWAHVVTALAVVLPALFWALRQVGADIRTLLSVLWPPVLAAIPTYMCGRLVASYAPNHWLGLVGGGTLGLAIYVALLLPWFKRFRKAHVDDAAAAEPSSSEQDPASARVPERVGDLT